MSLVLQRKPKTRMGIGSMAWWAKLRVAVMSSVMVATAGWGAGVGGQGRKEWEFPGPCGSLGFLFTPPSMAAGLCQMHCSWRTTPALLNVALGLGEKVPGTYSQAASCWDSSVFKLRAGRRCHGSQSHVASADASLAGGGVRQKTACLPLSLVLFLNSLLLGTQCGFLILSSGLLRVALRVASGMMVVQETHLASSN